MKTFDEWWNKHWSAISPNALGGPAMRRGWDACAAEHAGEVERLKAVVDALPKTADGVPIVPNMTVFTSNYLGQDRIVEAEVWSISTHIRICGMGMSVTVWLLPHLLYSTCEAAEKSKVPS